MIAEIIYKNKTYQVDLNKPVDLSVPLGSVNCFYAPELKIEPYRSAGFVGSVKVGGPVNFFNVSFNPHGNGTHTECYGHITSKHEKLNHINIPPHLIVKLISLEPQLQNDGDLIITKDSLLPVFKQDYTEALIIRTLPNHISKKTQNYSGQNPPYIHKETMQLLVENGIKHLIIDLPSVDKEVDGGLLEAHRAFWGVEGDTCVEEDRSDCTITELAYVPNHIEDGLFLLNLQTIPLELDASPSRPVIFRMIEKEP